MPPNHIFTRLAALGLLLLVSACQMLPVTQPSADSSIESYAAQLVQMNADELSAEFEDVRTTWHNEESATSRARLGLIRGMWGHSDFNPEQGAHDLREALVQSPAHWTTNQRAFLEFQAAQLDTLAQRDAAAAASANGKSQIEQELKMAREKLKAISDIERDIGR